MLSLALSLALAAPDAGALLSRPVEIRADKLELDNKQQRATYTGNAKAVRDTTTLTCDRIEVQLSAREVQRITARGNVVAIDGDREARGDEADYDNGTGVLTVRGNPRGKQGNREITGEQLTFTTGIDRLTVTKAKTRVEDPKDADKLVAIDADLLVLENPKSIATWKGNVRARRGNMLLTAPELTAHYDEHGAITRLEARGGVEATEADRWARGQRADYDVARGVLVVTGKPEAREGKTRMKGTKVTFLSGRNFLEVENATTVFEVEKKGAKP